MLCFSFLSESGTERWKWNALIENFKLKLFRIQTNGEVERVKDTWRSMIGLGKKIIRGDRLVFIFIFYEL